MSCLEGIEGDQETRTITVSDLDSLLTVSHYQTLEPIKVIRLTESVLTPEYLQAKGPEGTVEGIRPVLLDFEREWRESSDYWGITNKFLESLKVLNGKYSGVIDLRKCSLTKKEYESVELFSAANPSCTVLLPESKN